VSEFISFPKIVRLRRECIITEKLDGTNAQVCIGEDGSIKAGSRNRWITPDDDNHGFARWVEENKTELMKLGPGRHFGEWWGQGIQRGYGLTEKRFSLFNVMRWGDPEVRPQCCHVVPVLDEVLFTDTVAIEVAFQSLDRYGSQAAPGFMRPEGIVVFHKQGGLLFKRTFEKDIEGKGEAREGAQRLLGEAA